MQYTKAGKWGHALYQLGRSLADRKRTCGDELQNLANTMSPSSSAAGDSVVIAAQMELEMTQLISMPGFLHGGSLSRAQVRTLLSDVRTLGDTLEATFDTAVARYLNIKRNLLIDCLDWSGDLASFVYTCLRGCTNFAPPGTPLHAMVQTLAGEYIKRVQFERRLGWRALTWLCAFQVYILRPQQRQLAPPTELRPKSTQ